MSNSKAPIRLLHLEDNPRAAQLVHEKLAAQGITCSIVHVEGRSQFESMVSKEQFDLVLCDYNLPHYDGFAAMRRVRRAQPEVPVIFMSGSMGDDPTDKIRSMGAADYLLKYRLDRLVPAMKRALKGAAERRKQFSAEQNTVRKVRMTSLPHGEAPCAAAA